MQNTGSDGAFGADHGGSPVANLKGVVSTLVGAFAALAVLLALGTWFYRLGMREPQSVPIVRAASEPAKVRPEDPGGIVTPHQDMESYEVAGAGPVHAAAVIMAPAPPAPRREDLAMGTFEPEPSPAEEAPEVAVKPPARALASEDPMVAVAEPPEKEYPIIVASVSMDPIMSRPAKTTPKPAKLAGGTKFAPMVSPRAPRKPTDLRDRVAAAAVEADREIVDLAMAAAASKIQIQLAADPNEAAILSHWTTVYEANKDILRNRALSVQTTISGGTKFYRLRVGPFRNKAEAASVCEALKARGEDCIVAWNG